MDGLGVSGDLLRSIFERSLPIPKLYVEVLRAMAEMAESDGGRELSATPVQIANRVGIDSPLEARPARRDNCRMRSMKWSR